MDEGRFEEALEYFTLAYKNEGNNRLNRADCLLHQALALDKLGHIDEAFEKAQESFSLNSNDALALEFLIKIENQLQSTKFAYDCEEGQYHINFVHFF